MISMTRGLLALSFAALAGCTTPEALTQEPYVPVVTATRSALLDLPEPTRKLEVAVYKFEDLTGQYKPSENFQSLSRAVSQGGSAVLVKALQDAGNRKWFTVVERTSLTSLLQERKIIRELRQRYLGETEVNAQALPPMLFAGVLLEGGVVGYDSNTITGGAGAALLGIGGKAEYRHDTISVTLRAISVKTGEVLASVLVQKTVISTGIAANVFRYIDFDEILEIEAGVTTNEPGLVALRKAIEKSVYALIMEGVGNGLWEFKNPEEGAPLINAYLVEEGRATPAAPEPAPVKLAKRAAPAPAAAEAPVPAAPAPASDPTLAEEPLVRRSAPGEDTPYRHAARLAEHGTGAPEAEKIVPVEERDAQRLARVNAIIDVASRSAVPPPGEGEAADIELPAPPPSAVE